MRLPPGASQLAYVQSARALLRPQRRADGGDQLLGVDRLVDAVDEARGHQALALDLGERGERDRRRIALVAAGELDRAPAAQRLETVLARHGEVDEQPRPPARRAAEVSAWLKRSKTCGRNSGWMPMPLSFTCSCTRSAFLCRWTLIVPPSGVNFTAFDSRFDASCCRRPASPITMIAGSSGEKRSSRCLATATGRAASSAASTVSARLTTRRSMVSLPLTMRDVSSRSSISRVW